MYALGNMFAGTQFCPCFLLRETCVYLTKFKMGSCEKVLGSSQQKIICVSCDLTCPACPCSYILLLLALSGRSLFPIFSSRNAEHVIKQSAFLLSLNILILSQVKFRKTGLAKFQLSELPCSFPSFFIMLPASRLSNYVPKFLRSYSLISYVLVARGSIY